MLLLPYSPTACHATRITPLLCPYDSSAFTSSPSPANRSSRAGWLPLVSAHHYLGGGRAEALNFEDGGRRLR